MSDKKVYVYLPCYNEENNIEPLVRAWINQRGRLQEKGYKLRITVIDDKSIDKTGVIAKRLEEAYDEVNLVSHEHNGGLGEGLKTAILCFIYEGKKGDIMFLMDGDNTHDPKYSISMVEMIEWGYDCVIASRYCKGSSVKGVPSVRLFLSFGARIYYSMILRCKNVRDYTCGYRAYTYRIIRRTEKRYGGAIVERKSFACMMELLYKLNTVGAKCGEVPFQLRYDMKGGDSKMKILKTVRESLFTALQLRFGHAR